MSLLLADGPASDREILVARLLDRALRPLLPMSGLGAVQVMGNLLVTDGQQLPEAHAICAASAAVCLGNICSSVFPVG